MFKKVNPRQNFPEMEKDVLKFWQENKIFEKSVDNKDDQKIYSFFDGPPFATGLPHYGHVVANLMKDVVPRYWTMRGYKVERRWGWDCHGLPVENLIEKEHKIKNKQEIEKWGIDNFNKACCDSVLRYADEWKKFIPRIGRWVDMENDYRTMDWKYTESIWWVFSELYKKGLIYEGYKSMHICPRCETTLSNFEVTQGYKEITDLSATVKFKLKTGQKIGNFKVDENTFVLAWTTTPWTLPGNVALAVGVSIKYQVVSIKGENDFYVLAKDRIGEILKDREFEVLNEIDGKELVGLEYEPLFGYLKRIIEKGLTPRVLKMPESNKGVEPQFARNPDAYKKEDWDKLMKEMDKSLNVIESFKNNAYKIYSDSENNRFVTMEEGTGIVHIAPAFGDDDYKLSKKENLPMVQHISMDGRFYEDITEEIGKDYEEFTEVIKDKKESERRGKWAGVEVKPKGEKGEKDPHMKTDIEIIKYLAHNNYLFAKEKYKHSYPHCWRCDTPLLNYATSSWFVKVTEIKDKMVKNNQEINWTPEYIKDGRFGKWLEDARDWAVSRSRFWGAPLPIWRCGKCKNVEVINSIDDLRNKTDQKITKFILLRHGESESNVLKIKAGGSNKYGLTEKGIKQCKAVAKDLKNQEIDFIVTSPIKRTKQTTEIINKELSLEVIEDELVKEYDFGKWNECSHQDLIGKNDLYDKYRKLDYGKERYNFAFGGDGESRQDIENRVRKFIDEYAQKYSGKNILVVAHGGINAMFNRVINECSIEKTFKTEPLFGNAEQGIFYTDKNGKRFDLHKPNIDDVKIKCSKCGEEAKIVGDVFDCWFESGSMPYAQCHYPFENKDKFEKSFPADFIAEGIDQTRGWFYTLMVLSTALFDKPAFKNVIANGIVQAENGQKMSKRLKNYPEPNLLIEKYGADALRYYLLTSPVMKAENLNFSEKGVEEVLKKFILTLWNVYSFLVMNATPPAPLIRGENDIPSDKRGTLISPLDKEGLGGVLLDKWILSEFNILVEEVNKQMQDYDLAKAARPLREFADKLSNWFVRRSRKRFTSENTEDRDFAFQTLYYILTEYSKLLAPFMPFIAEEIYQNLTDKKSVHFEDYPIADKSLIDEKVSDEMNFVREVVALGLAIRAKNGLKVRQPLAELRIVNCELITPTSPPLIRGGELIPPLEKGARGISEMDIDDELVNLIKDELNVKNIGFVDNLQKGSTALRDYGTSGDNWICEDDGKIKIALDIEITEELKLEGYAREIVRHIQVMRKEAKYDRGDIISVKYNLAEDGEDVKKVFDVWGDYIKKECLVKSIESGDELNDSDFDLAKELKLGDGGVKIGIGQKRKRISPLKH